MSRRSSLSVIGERGFIGALLPALLRQGRRRFLIPPGDDAAVLLGSGRPVLSIDGLTEGTHFRLDWAPRMRRHGASFGRLLGWKLIGSSLSDLAAMGRTGGRWALLYLGAPGGLPARFLLDIAAGAQAAAARYGCVIAGGDTVRAQALTLVCAVGGRLRSRPLPRGGARAGDLLCIAGRIGDAHMGLAMLSGRIRAKRADAGRLINRFFLHQPLFEAGEALAADPGVSAAMDLSDALCESVPLLLGRGGIGAELDVERLPVSALTRRYGAIDGRLLSAGEDYALLFSVAPSAVARLSRRLRFHVVGRVTATAGVRYRLRGRPCRPDGGFSHF